jgi:hypothetical protein
MKKILGILVIVIAVTVSSTAQSRRDTVRFAEDRAAALKVGVTETEDFFPRTSYSYPVADFKPGVVQVGPRTTFLKEGLRTEEVFRLLGKPANVFERNENGVIVTTCEFERGDGRTLIAEFVNGVLVKSRQEINIEHSTRADR